MMLWNCIIGLALIHVSPSKIQFMPFLIFFGNYDVSSAICFFLIHTVFQCPGFQQNQQKIMTQPGNDTVWDWLSPSLFLKSSQSVRCSERGKKYENNNTNNLTPLAVLAFFHPWELRSCLCIFQPVKKEWFLFAHTHKQIVELYRCFW